MEPEILAWIPPATTEAACGGEHIRGLVLSTSPRMPHHYAPETPKETPKTTPRTSPAMSPGSVNASSAVNAPTATAELVEIHELLKAQGVEFMQSIESLFAHQERTVISLLEDRFSSSFPCNEKVVHEHDVGSAAQELLQERLLKHHQTRVSFRERLRKTHTTNSSTSSSICSTQKQMRGSASYARPHERETQSKKLHQSVASVFMHAMVHGKTSLLPTAPTVNFSTIRQSLQNLLHAPLYDLVMTLTIVFNTILIVIEADSNADCNTKSQGCAPTWLAVANFALLVIYTIESAVVIYVYQMKTFQQKARMFEIFIVIAGYLDLIIVQCFGDSFPSIQALKLIRLTRLLRGMRLFNFFPELNFIVVGFASAMKAMLWGYIMLMLLLLATGIACVELIHPLNERVHQEDEYCATAFASVWNATIWLFQTSTAGDGWGNCSIPIIRFMPGTVIFFAGVLVALQVGFLNLIMSVIIDRVAEARENDTTSKLARKEKEMGNTLKKWFALFDKLDRDHNGELSEEELLRGFESLPDFSADLKLLGLQKWDIPNLLSLMDTDHNSQVSVDELLSLFEMVVHFDDKMHQVMMGLELRMIGQRVESRIQKLEREIKRLPSAQFSNY